VGPSGPIGAIGAQGPAGPSGAAGESLGFQAFTVAPSSSGINRFDENYRTTKAGTYVKLRFGVPKVAGLLSTSDFVHYTVEKGGKGAGARGGVCRL
jgi:hypothetical protein